MDRRRLKSLKEKSQSQTIMILWNSSI